MPVISKPFLTAESVAVPSPLRPGSFPADKRADFFAKHPQTSSWKLSNGESVKLPMHVQDMETVQILGRVNPKIMNPELEKSGVELLPIPFIGGIAALVGARYYESSIGPYNEIVVGALVRDLEDHSRIGFHMMQLYVTSDVSQMVGREVWGYPKEMAAIEIDSATKRTQVFSATLADGTPLLNVRWKKFLPLPSRLMNLPFHTSRMWITNPSQTRGVRMGIFAGGDRVEYSRETAWGDLLNRAGFRPMMWQSTEAFMGALPDPR